MRGSIRGGEGGVIWGWKMKKGNSVSMVIGSKGCGGMRLAKCQDLGEQCIHDGLHGVRSRRKRRGGGEGGGGRGGIGRQRGV